MLNTKRLVICCSFRTISNTNINIYRSERSHSLTSVKRKGDPPVCTMRQLAQTSFLGSTKASSKADRGMTVLITLLILRKNPFLILNDNKDKKINSLSKYCTSGPKFRGEFAPPPLPAASYGPVRELRCHYPVTSEELLLFRCSAHVSFKLTPTVLPKRTYRLIFG